jgi:Flp pilus assembly protein TadD
MTRFQSPKNAAHIKALGFVVQGTLAAALLFGAGSGTAMAKVKDPAVMVQKSLAAGDFDQAIVLGEAALTAKPQDVVLRALLGNAYFKAGRFESAAAALNDAVSLGDASGRTSLALSLSQIAVGRGRDALNTLDRAQTAIPAGDFGLAVALAGDAGRGIVILSDALRADPNPKLRQNLAYAYALNGQWTEARVAASADVTPDRLDARITGWAKSMRAGGEQERIANLIGVPVVADAGMPVQLALNAPAAGAVLAVAEPVAVPVAPSAVAELPALAAKVDVPVAEPAAVSAPVAVAVVEPVAAPVPQYEAVPVVQQVAAPVRNEPVYNAPISGGSHVVQLGAFSSAGNAARAKVIFAARNPQLRGREFVVTQAVVKGRNFWRVAVSGYDAGSAGSLCASVKRGGGVCFAYAVGHAPTGERMASNGLKRAKRVAMAK